MFQDKKKKAVHTKMSHILRQAEGSPHKDEPCFKTTRRRQSTQRWAVSRQQEESSPHKMGHVSRQQEKGSPHKDGPCFKTRKRQSTQRWAMFQDNKKKAVHTKMCQISRQQEKGSTRKDGPGFKTTRGNPHIDGLRSKDAQYI